MNSNSNFDAEVWIDRVSKVLPKLKQVQEPYLQAYWRTNPPTHIIRDGKEVTPFPLEDLRTVFAEARHGRMIGKEVQYQPLVALLDSARHALLSHPELERVAVSGRIIGENKFYLNILNYGTITCAGDLIAGLMARAAELPGNGYPVAVAELNAFLQPIRNASAVNVLGGLDEGYHVLLFYGLTLTERADIEKDIAILPFKKVRRFLTQDLVEELVPRLAEIHGWRSVGALVKPFRWRPKVKRRGSLNEPVAPPQGQFVLDTKLLLNLISVSHEAPVMPLAVILNCIDCSAMRLLGQENCGIGASQKWTATGFDVFAEYPKMDAAALDEALEGFRGRKSANFQKMAPIVTRLANALRRDGQYAISDKVMDLAIALEGMFELPRQGKSKNLGDRVSGFVGKNATERARIKEIIRRFYDARSDIVHRGKGEEWPLGKEDVFIKGFSLARRSLYKFLRDGALDNWGHLR